MRAAPSTRSSTRATRPEFEKAVLDTIAEASKIVADTAADELDAFKAFILGVAHAAAESSGAVDDNEQTAIDKIKGALV